MTPNEKKVIEQTIAVLELWKSRPDLCAELRTLLKQESVEPFAVTKGYYGGYPIIEPINRLLCIGADIPLYLHPPTQQEHKELEEIIERRLIREGRLGIRTTPSVPMEEVQEMVKELQKLHAKHQYVTGGNPTYYGKAANLIERLAGITKEN